MEKINMKQLKSDTAVYLDRARKIITLSYVDDLLTSTPDDETTATYYDELSNDLEIKRMGFPQLFLGVVLQENDDGITLHQDEYAKGILDAFDMIHCNSVSTPMEPGSYREAVLEKMVMTSPQMKERYASLIGKVNYLVTQTRPDLAFTNGLWARFLSNPTEAQFACAKRLLRHIQESRSLGIRYTRSSQEAQEKYGNPYGLHAYCDSDYAADPDTSKSVAGYVFIMNGGVISWSSKRQSTVAKSTAEAEYYALSMATSEAIWIRTFLEELGEPLTNPIVIYNDNESAEKLAHNPEYHNKTKHIRIHHHFVRDAVDDDLIKVVHVPSAGNAADGLTKPLTKAKHQEFVRLIGMSNP
jgi:hypothetical protein